MTRESMPTRDALAEIYKASWRDPARSRSETGGTDGWLARIYVDRLMQSLGLISLSEVSVLDFGAGRGAMMEALAERGASPVGVDPYGWRHLRMRGLAAHPHLEAVGGVMFDGVVMLDVIEHLVDPLALLETLLQDVIAPGGWLFMATPNARSVRARMFRDDWGEARKAGHLVLFSPRGQELILRAAGYSDIRRQRWLVPYSTSRLRNGLHLAQQLMGVDGELRYLARRAQEGVT